MWYVNYSESLIIELQNCCKAYCLLSEVHRDCLRDAYAAGVVEVNIGKGVYATHPYNPGEQLNNWGIYRIQPEWEYAGLKKINSADLKVELFRKELLAEFRKRCSVSEVGYSVTGFPEYIHFRKSEEEVYKELYSIVLNHKITAG